MSSTAGRLVGLVFALAGLAWAGPAWAQGTTSADGGSTSLGTPSAGGRSTSLGTTSASGRSTSLGTTSAGDGSTSLGTTSASGRSTSLGTTSAGDGSTSLGTTTPVAPVGSPAPIKLRFQLENAARVPVSAVITGGRIRVVGTVTPYVAAQSVFVRTFRGSRKLYTRRVPVTGAGNGIGHFVALIGVGGRTAPVSVEVSHPATSLQAGHSGVRRSLPVVAGSVSPGQRSAAVGLLQHDLAAQHYAVPSSGVYDAATQRAVVAFRKMTNQVRSDQANRRVFELLAAGAGAFPVRFPGQADHFEGDLTHQVLAEVQAGGKVRRLYEMSSGKPSTPTVIGTFRVYLKTLGINEKGMVDSNYFIRGYAIHGYPDVPTYAASHGCLRIPVPDAASVFAWAQYGDPVDVYYRNGGGSHQISANAGP